MELEAAALKTLIERAFDSGYWGHGGGREEVLASLVAELGDQEDKADDDFRVYRVEELRDMPEGAEFEHSHFGHCKVSVVQGEKLMLFNWPQLPLAGFNHDGHPWDIPMRRVK